MLFEFLFPYLRHCAVYDNATVHRSKGSQTLDASLRDRSPSGEQRKQRDTTYSHFTTGEKVKQSSVNEHDVAKGPGCLRFCGSVANEPVAAAPGRCHVEPRLQGPGFKFVERAHLLRFGMRVSDDIRPEVAP